MASQPVERNRRESDNHPHFSQPQDWTARVWRYFPWPRFMQALKSGNLWFARADELRRKDPCEGGRTLPDAEAMALVREEFLNTGRRGDWIRAAANLRRLDEDARRSTFISCWQMRKHDMISMWDRYCITPQLGVAVQTTYERLHAAVPAMYGLYEHIMLGVMQYEDRRTDLANSYSPFMTKKVNYSDEHEVRLLFMSASPISEKGVNVEVSWTALVERVVVSPYGSPVFASAVERFCREQEFGFPVVRSTARDEVLAFPF